jgi:membrane protein implicated in regulation of membrane protease activity
MYRSEWIASPLALGLVLLPLLAPPFAMIGLLVVAVAAVAAVAALAVAVLASPYLLVRAVRRHLAERHPSPAHSAEIVGVHMPALVNDPS